MASKKPRAAAGSIADRLARLAAEVERGQAQADSGHQAWLNARREMADALALVRSLTPSDIAFAAWCDAQGLGKTDLAELLRIGQDARLPQAVVRADRPRLGRPKVS